MTSFSWLSTWMILFLWNHDVHFQRRTSPDATWNSTHCRETCSSFLLSKKRQKGIRTRMYSTTLREDRDGVRREAAAAIPSPVSSPLFKGNTRPAYNNLLSPRSPSVFVSWLGLCYICPPPPRDQCCHHHCCRAWREIKFNLWAFLKVNRNTHLQK